LEAVIIPALTSKEEQDVCQESVYERLFLSLAPLLRNFLLYKFKDLERAEDMVQEAFFIMWQNCRKVTPALAKAYLFKVAQNQFLKLLDKDKVRQKHLDFQTVQQNEQNPEFQMEYNEFEGIISRAIDQLPEGQREVFLLNRIEKKTYVEIAEMLGVSVKAVEKRMHKALLKLRKVCKEI
jgi:RNA polymerase sigma-70 factor (ECF subfamily)